MPISPNSAVYTATIANGTALSDEIDLTGYSQVAIIMPAAWTAAAITIAAASASGGTFVPVYLDSGTELSITVAASRAIVIFGALGVPLLGPLRFIKLRSGPVGAPVNQGADRLIDVLMEA